MPVKIGPKYPVIVAPTIARINYTKAGNGRWSWSVLVKDGNATRRLVRSGSGFPKKAAAKADALDIAARLGLEIVEELT